MDLSAEFAALIATAADGTLPRPQVEAELHSALAGGEPVLVLLRGVPGSGKTCLLARALRERGSLHHFLRRGHTELALWRDPHAFLLSIGFQLKAAHGDELFPSSVAIDVDQTLHELDEGGLLTGVRVERLYALPWATVNIRVRQHVVRAGGEVAGVTIAELIDEVHRIPLPVFREMALLGPLRRLRLRKPDARVVLVVDALDEEGADADGIGSVLPLADELAAIGNLTIVVASRPGPALQRFVDSGSRLVDLADARFDGDRRAFADAFVAREQADAGVQAAIAAAGTDAAALATMLADRGGSSPLYLAQFFAAVRRGELPALLAGGLPQGLDAIHSRLADSLARRPDFAARVAPLLAVFCVARRPLPLQQLARFAKLAPPAAQQGVDTLAPFLIGAPEGWAIYHRAFQETLVDAAHCEAPWSVAAAAANDRIAAAYLPDPAGPPDGLDDYGLTFLASHLAAGGEASLRRLLDLPDRTWCRRRRAAAGSLWPVLGDLQLAVRVARSLPPGHGLPAVARLALLAGRIHDAERELPLGLLDATVRAGQLQRALDSVSPEMRIDDQVARLTEIVAALAVVQRTDGARLSALARQLLRQALALVARDPDGWTLAKLLEACPPDAATTLADWVGEAGELARTLPADWKRPRAIGAAARLHAALDADTGRAWFEAALKDCERLRSSRSLEEGRLARGWLAFDPAAAADLLKRLHFTADATSTRTILDIARVLETQGNAGALANLAGQVLSMLGDFVDPYKRALAEAGLGRAFVDVGDGDAARSALLRADAAQRRIGGDDDPERGLQNRPRMIADAVAATAALAVDLAAPDAMQRLEQAWAAFASPGFHNADPGELIELQQRSEPALLEVYIGQLPGAARLAARLAALPTLFGSADPADRALALRWYAEALLEAEQHADAGSATGYLRHAHLKCAPAAQVDAAVGLADATLSAEDRVAVRLALFERVPGPRAAGWLSDVVAQWAEGVESIYGAFQLPGWLLGVPAPLANALLQRPLPPAPPPRAALLELALGALAERLAAGSGQARFDDAVAALDAAATEAFPAAALQAFAAGAWWRYDAQRATSLWHAALLWLNRHPAFATDALHRHTWLMILADALEAGDPQAALSVYLANPEPAPEPGTLTFTVPGPAVDALEQTGMTRRDRHLAALLARAGLATPDLEPAALRALTLMNSASTSPATRLGQLQAALAATAPVEPSSLRALLQAKAVRGLAAMGAHSLAADKAGAVIDAVRKALPVFGTIPTAGYAAALGELAAAALLRGDMAQAADCVFDARQLGAEGVDRALMPLCSPLVALDEGAWTALQAEAERGWAR